ncbi:MAG: A/G-specific adenine glycosylase [Alphaproteobacteria bacterium]|nr:A/G-specific adenine glycosylase [Alphaproteobacteria bacterium]
MVTLAYKLLKWYDKNGRHLPWRIKGGAHPNPYVILVSEFMLQQTTVKTVIPYFEKFMQRFPTIEDLASASQEEVYHYWQGLGYYTRAKSLHQTAQQIVSSACFPKTRDEVLKLKGIGAYTASSFLALAFNLPETVIDGNVMRIMARLYALTSPLDEIQDVIREKAENLTDTKCPADYASAIMDLGATICTPKKPKCSLCPWKNDCLSYGRQDIENIPQRKKLPKKQKVGFVYLINNSQGEILIRLRTEKGLLSGLYEFPWAEEKLFKNAKDTGQQVVHIFTHFKLTLNIMVLQIDNIDCDGFFVPVCNLSNYPMSTLMKKVIKAF